MTNHPTPQQKYSVDKTRCQMDLLPFAGSATTPYFWGVEWGEEEAGVFDFHYVG
jgi:hypothetical protein